MIQNLPKLPKRSRYLFQFHFHHKYQSTILCVYQLWSVIIKERVGKQCFSSIKIFSRTPRKKLLASFTNFWIFCTMLLARSFMGIPRLVNNIHLGNPGLMMLLFSDGNPFLNFETYSTPYFLFDDFLKLSSMLIFSVILLNV